MLKKKIVCRRFKMKLQSFLFQIITDNNVFVPTNSQLSSTTDIFIFLFHLLLFLFFMVFFFFFFFKVKSLCSELCFPQIDARRKIKNKKKIRVRQEKGTKTSESISKYRKNIHTSRLQIVLHSKKFF